MATLLNNQALALSDSGRHDKAIEIYKTAIESQRRCLEQMPELSLMRDVLSKMYYNYGQSLRKTGNLREAADAALARRELWHGNGARLLGVAAELAEICSISNEDMTFTKGTRQTLDKELWATLRQAQKSGWPRDFDLRKDKRFSYLHNNEQFNELTVELAGTPTESTTEHPGGHLAPNTAN